MDQIRVFINLLWFIAFWGVSVNGWERNIFAELNPGCPDTVCNGTYSVLHITAKGPNDTLHYICDLTKKPSLFLALTEHHTQISFNWNSTNGLECSIKFSEAPLYKFGVVLNKMWEYNDVNDTGIFDQKNQSDAYVRLLHPEKFEWNKTEYEHPGNNRSVTLGVTSKRYVDGNITKNGTVHLLVKGFGFLDHSEVLPHLLHTPNTSQVDFVIDGLTTEPSFTNSRFALELVLVGSDQSAKNVQILERKSLDDEHAPGVFTLLDVETPDSAGSAQGGYLQWRPVAYISRVRDIANSTETNIYNPRNISNPASDLNGTLVLSAFCNNGSVSMPLAQAAAVSFGTKEDGFYKKTKYTAWTFTVGYGKPPDEDFSLLVILVISIGLGLPAVLILASGLVMLVRRVSRKKDDLFLGR